MKRTLSLITLLWLTLPLVLADDYNFDKIALTPYIESVNKQNGAADKLLTNKLNQLVLKCGMAGKSINDRFIITAHASEIERVPTATTPVKYALRIMLTIYVGDGIDGMMFSSYSAELKGIGSSLDDAYLSAYRKLSINNPDLINSVEIGRNRIIDYYNSRSAEIISHAKALAKAGNYDEAVYQLFLVPPGCNGYDDAQYYAGEFAAEACDKSNEIILSNARAAWAASPDESGAREARRILSEISNPSEHISAKSNALSKEIAGRLQHVEDKQMQLEAQRERNRHAESMQTIRSAERVAKTQISANASVARTRARAARDVAVAYYNSRPRVVYNVHWW